MNKMRFKKVSVVFAMLVVAMVSILGFSPKENIYASSGLSIKMHWERDNESKDYISNYEISANGPVYNLVVLSPANDGKFNATVLFFHKVNENTLSRGISGRITYNSLHWYNGTDITETKDFDFPSGTFSESDIGKYASLVTISLGDTFNRTDFSGWNVTFDSLVDINNALSDGSFTFDKVNLDPDPTILPTNDDFDIDAIGKLKIKNVTNKNSKDNFRVDIEYALKTTAGLIVGEDVVVRGYIQVVYTDSKGNIVYESPLEYYNTSDTTIFEYDHYRDLQNDICNKYPKEKYGQTVGATYTYEYLAPYSESLNKYGTMVKVVFDSDKKCMTVTEVDSISDNVPSCNDETSTPVDEYVANGETDEDADVDAQDKKDNGDKVVVPSFNDLDFDGAVNTATGLLNMIGNVPKVLAKLFSFLPDWCLNLLAFSFVVIVILIVYKLARG